MVLLSSSSRRSDSGFALMMVLWTVAILSAVSLSLIASSRAEARHASEKWDRLKYESLVRSGHEVERYLRTRSLGSAAENLSGTPVQALTAGFRYTIQLPEGVVDVFLESDAGKVGLVADDVQLLQNFLTRWQGQAAASIVSVDAIKDWNKQYRTIGVGALPLIRGFSFDDFQPKLTQDSSVRESLDEFVTTTAGATINPNFAPKLVLLSVPGLSSEQVDALVNARRQGALFRNVDEFRSQMGIAADHPALRYLRFDRGLTPAVLTIVKDASGRQYTERRVYELIPSFNTATGGYESAIRLQRLQSNYVPPFLRN